MNISNLNVNNAQQDTTELKEWRPLKLRILKIGQNTHSGATVKPSVENAAYRPS